MNIAFIGECMIELSRTETGYAQRFGGDTLNTAVYLSRLCQNGSDAHVHYFSALGIDPFSTQMLDAWRKEGIQTEGVYQDPSRLPGLYVIETSEYGERSFHFWRSDSAAKAMFEQPDSELWLAKLISNDVIFISGVTLGILSGEHRDTLYRYLRIAKSDGKKVIFDNNYRAQLWTDVHEAREAFDAVLAISDIALLSFEDDQAVFHSKDPLECFDRIQTQTPQELVIKNGGDDCWYSNAERLPQRFALEKIPNVKDTTAAGDSFNAGYLFRRFQGGSAQQAIESGHKLASKVIQHEGAIISADLLDQTSTPLQIA